MNNLDEYSRCLIPTLEVQRGDNESTEAKKSRDLRLRTQKMEAEQAWSKQTETQDKRPQTTGLAQNPSKKPKLTQTMEPTNTNRPKMTEIQKGSTQHELPKATNTQIPIMNTTQKRKRQSDENEIDTHARKETNQLKNDKKTHKVTHITPPQRRKLMPGTSDKPQPNKQKQRPTAAPYSSKANLTNSQPVDIRKFFNIKEKRESTAREGGDPVSNPSNSKIIKHCDNLNLREGDIMTNSNTPKTTDLNVLDQFNSKFRPSNTFDKDHLE